MPKPSQGGIMTAYYEDRNLPQWAQKQLRDIRELNRKLHKRCEQLKLTEGEATAMAILYRQQNKRLTIALCVAVVIAVGLAIAMGVRK